MEVGPRGRRELPHLASNRLEVVARRVHEAVAGACAAVEGARPARTASLHAVGKEAAIYFDARHTVSNHIAEVFEVLGIEAARQLIIDEVMTVIVESGSSISYVRSRAPAPPVCGQKGKNKVFCSFALVKI